MKNNSGFTLLEVLIAVTIMSFLSYYTYEAIRTGVKRKAKIQTKIDKESSVLDALSIISKDVQKAFNYRDINVIAFNNAQKERQKRDNDKSKKKNSNNTTTTNTTTNNTTTTNTNNSDQATSDADKYKLKEEVIMTHFIGSEDELHFTSLSNLRKKKNDPTSDQSEVGYYLKSCKGRLDKSKSSTCLWRRISPYIDDDITKGGSETVLLENVEEFRLRYLGPGREEEWVKNWKTDERGDAITQGKFPYVVEITISIKDPKRKKSVLSMTGVAPIRFSNNLEQNNSTEESGDQPNDAKDPQNGQ